MAGNIHFLFQDAPLNFSPAHVSDILYLEAKAKVLRQKDLDQANKLQTMLRQIQQVQQTAKPKMTYQSKVIVGPRKIGDFYQYNQEWQSKIDKKNQEARKQQQLKIAYDEEASKEFKTREESIGLTDYCGPISGWNHHFQNYIKVRTEGCQTDKELFKPKLNKNSERIIQKKYAGKSKERVEERLFKQSQQKKIHNYSTIKSETQHGTSRSVRANPEIFQKLYNDASKQARKKQEIRQQAQYSFQPKINKNTPYDQSVTSRRKPLYMPTEPSHTSVIPQEKKIQREYSQQQFNDFLQRNDVLISKRKNIQLQLKKESDEWMMRECTFTPLINQRSVTLIENTRHTSSFKSQINEISSDSLELEVEKIKSNVVVPLIPPIPPIERESYDSEVLKTQESTRRRELHPILNSIKRKQQVTIKTKEKKQGYAKDPNQESRDRKRQMRQSDVVKENMYEGYKIWSKGSEESGVEVNMFPEEIQSIDEMEEAREEVGNKREKEQPEERQEKQSGNEQFLDEFQLIQRQLQEMINAGK